MKKKIKKIFRHIRYRICRYIVGFYTCPNFMKKDRKTILIQGLTATVISGLAIILFLLMFLMA